MNQNPLQRLQVLRDKLGALKQRAATAPAGPLPLDTLQDVLSSLEDLQAAVAEKEADLRRLAAEAERWHYQNLFDSAPEGYLVTDTDGIVREANSAAAALLGTRQDRLVGRPLIEYLAEEDRAAFRELLARLSRGMASEDCRLNMTTRGWTFTAALTVACMRDFRGSVTGLRWLARDISEHRRLEDEARAGWEKQRAVWLKTILDELPAAVVIATAPDGRIEMANAAAEAMWGIAPARVTPGEWNKRWRLLRPDGTEVGDSEFALTRAVLQGEHVQGEEYTMEQADGSRVSFSANAAPFFEDGRVTGGALVFRNITTEKEVQSRLEAAGRLKDEFLSLASHELKTPITSIRLFTELATRRPDRVDTGLMETVTRQAEQLVRLVDDLLHASMCRLGRLPVEMRPLDLADLLRGLCDRMRQAYTTHQLICLIPGEAVTIAADPPRVEQIFFNLLENAKKFSHERGRIFLELHANGEKATVSVRDEGIGIAPQDMPHVFECFYKPLAHQAIYPGLGVGLYICQEIVKLHGGRIWAESKEDGGSEFFVELPLVNKAGG
ncbi:MAG: ATP-binding protein [Pseudomonadota bacterium]